MSALAIDRAVRVTDLSRGMQARLAFVLGLSHRPGLVLLDEPLLGVDVVTHDVVLEMLANGASTEEVLSDHPSLVRDDVLAAIAYAAVHMSHAVIRVA